LLAGKRKRKVRSKDYSIITIKKDWEITQKPCMVNLTFIEKGIDFENFITNILSTTITFNVFIIIK
jgi:hypothetical protein